MSGIGKPLPINHIPPALLRSLQFHRFIIIGIIVLYLRQQVDEASIRRPKDCNTLNVEFARQNRAAVMGYFLKAGRQNIFVLVTS